jgi:hypothetical protein
MKVNVLTRVDGGCEEVFREFYTDRVEAYTADLRIKLADVNIYFADDDKLWKAYNTLINCLGSHSEETFITGVTNIEATE